MRTFILSVLLLLPMLAFSGAGDEWTRVRGDGSPGLSYTAFIEAQNGRLIAAGRSGQLMISDNGGTDWRYEVIVDDTGRPVFGTISDLLLKDGVIFGTLLSLVPSSNRFGLPFEGQTRIISSGNNGNSWSVGTFPIREASFRGRLYPGVYLPKLHISPAGELLAYGTTLLSNGFVGWFIGGAVFRFGPGGWEQAYFENGFLQDMSDANGRLVASGFQTVLDSADGAGWNGYRFVDAQLLLGGNPMSFELKESLFASDITLVGGQYVMQAQSFKRLPSNPRVFTTSVERAFTFVSPNPFDGGRIWNATEQDRVYRNWLNVNDTIVSVFGAAYTSGNGTAFSLRDDTVDVFTGSVGPVGGSSVVAVGNSDEVWRSNDSGGTWSKILDTDPGPDLGYLRTVGDRILARIGSFSLDEIWISLDNGETWQFSTNVRDQLGHRISILMDQRGEQELFAPGDNASRIGYSADGGLTWQSITTPATTNRGLADIVFGQGGRMIIVPESKSITTSAEAYYSDDDGATWTTTSVPLGFNAGPKQGLHAGGGRIVYLMNGFASFDPELLTSNDNGVTWQREDPFQGLEGLSTVSGDPTTKVIDLERIFRTSTDNLVIVGDDGEILVSNDRGLSFTVAAHYELESPGVFFNWDLHDLVEVNGRLIVPGSRRSGPHPSTNVVFALISDDQGFSWREFIIPVNFGNTGLFHAAVGADGRVIFTGSNGAVYVSESEALDADEPARGRVREGQTLALEVPRPPADGDIEVAWSMAGAGAEAGVDFTATMGVLQWSAAETGPKVLMVETLDDAQQEPEEDLTIDLSLRDSLVINYSYRVIIDDNEGSGAFQVELVDGIDLVTDETGAQDTFGLALERQPSMDVTVDLANDDASEISFSPNTVTFTDVNWNQPQTITVTGLDDLDRDRDVTARIFLTVSSGDNNFDGISAPVVYVLNVDDERDEVVFASGFEPL